MKLSFETALDFLLESIRADYVTFWRDRELEGETVKEMISEFDANLSVVKGRKYYKIVNGGGVWGFVQKEDQGRFRAGDILKAASWASPARNAARGNILAGGYTAPWTGPVYL